LQLVEREERKIAANPKFERRLEHCGRLAAGHVFYELPGSESGSMDRFSTRKVGLRVNAAMASKFLAAMLGGCAPRRREWLARSLGPRHIKMVVCRESEPRKFRGYVSDLPRSVVVGPRRERRFGQTHPRKNGSR